MFKINQKVVFVDCNLKRNPDVIYPELHEIVTISKILTHPLTGGLFFSLKEYPISKTGTGNSILHICFRPLDDSFANETLERISKEVEEELQGCELIETGERL